MQQNIARGCARHGCPAGVTDRQSGWLLPNVLTAAFVNSSTTLNELQLNAMGSFAERIENTTLALGSGTNNSVL